MLLERIVKLEHAKSFSQLKVLPTFSRPQGAYCLDAFKAHRPYLFAHDFRGLSQIQRQHQS
jgi:hypothetical protein